MFSKFWIYIILIHFPIYFSGCDDTLETMDMMSEGHSDYSTLYTRSLETGWENCEEGFLPSGKRAFLPWYESAMTIIPDDIRNDIQGEDGWRILDSTIDFIGYEMEVTAVDATCNYLLMYNINTGILKGFYYMEEEADNNCGFWNLRTSQPTKLFNFAEYDAIPASDFGPQTVTIANLSTNAQTQGFEKGWNCFMIELAYDENSYQQKLNISGFAMNHATVTMQGVYQGKSSGTIVTSTQSASNPIKGTATSIGKAGAQWIMNKIGEDKPIKPAVLPKTTITAKGVSDAIKDIAEKGVAGLISNGIQKVFGSFIGSGHRSTTISSDLMFTTNGSATISGNLATPASGIISPITGLNLGSKDMNLGIWNLETTPELIVDPTAKLTEIIHGKSFVYNIHTKAAATTLKINPMVNQPYSITVTPVFSSHSIIKAEDSRINGDKDVVMHWASRNNVQVLYRDTNFVVSSYPFSYNIICEQWPNWMLNDDNGSIAVNFQYADKAYNLTNPISFKVLYSHHSNAVYSSKTFVPLQKFGYVFYSGHPHLLWTSNDFMDKHIPQITSITSK